MPPDGYKSVTVPDHVYDTLGEYAEQVNASTRAAAIQELLDGEDVPAGGIPVQDGMERLQSSVDTIEERTGQIEQTLEDLEGRMK